MDQEELVKRRTGLRIYSVHLEVDGDNPGDGEINNVVDKG